MEADLAFVGMDLRDLYRRSGLTLRRLLVLVRGLPAHSNTQLALSEQAEKALKPTAERIRERAAHYSKGGS